MGGNDIELMIYIDDSLIPEGDDLPSLPSTLLFGRMVNGAVNVVFQTIYSADMSTMNLITWKENYAISAFNTQNDYADGSKVTSSTLKKEITPGYVSDWNWGGSQMPEPTYDPDFEKYNPGAFGVKSELGKWSNAVWCQTGTSGGKPIWTAIYTDTPTLAKRALDVRSYAVENNYYIHFEDARVSSGVHYKEWDRAIPFSIPAGATSKYISYGPVPELKRSGWVEYTKDPGAHDPAAGNILNKKTSANAFQIESRQPGVTPDLAHQGAAPGAVAHISLDWINETTTTYIQNQYRDNVWNYINAATTGYLTWIRTNRLQDGKLLLSATLVHYGFEDLLQGNTDEEKIISLIRAVLQPIRPEASPLAVSFTN
ncbi:hypothetical protein F5884DRAFT_776912 [Xylogone sp. PMI_703]|nr:hypothetical protein F5884DRAFT_776912 [Xylogone sp. PMI_703]